MAWKSFQHLVGIITAEEVNAHLYQVLVELLSLSEVASVDPDTDCLPDTVAVVDYLLC